MPVEVLGVKITDLSSSDLLRKLEQELAIPSRTQPIFLVTPYSESLVRAQTDEEFRSILNRADFALPDGVGVLWAARYLSQNFQSALPAGRFSIFNFQAAKIIGAVGQLIASLLAVFFWPKYLHKPIPEKIPGRELMVDLAQMAERNNYSVFLLGGFGNTVNLAAQNLTAKFPLLKIAGTYSGNPKEQGMVQKINESKAQMLFVAFGPVKQEKWLFQNLSSLKVRLVMGVGGAFDYVAGRRPLPPQIWAKTGLEWLWRLVTQPWRVARIIRGVLGLIYLSFRKKLQV